MESKVSDTFNDLTIHNSITCGYNLNENVGEPNPHRALETLKLYSCNVLYISYTLNIAGNLHLWMETYFWVQYIICS